jgi:hypothetical protein
MSFPRPAACTVYELVLLDVMPSVGLTMQFRLHGSQERLDISEQETKGTD